jgi:hypothetical protein
MRSLDDDPVFDLSIVKEELCGDEEEPSDDVFGSNALAKGTASTDDGLSGSKLSSSNDDLAELSPSWPPSPRPLDACAFSDITSEVVIVFLPRVEERTSPAIERPTKTAPKQGRRNPAWP